ncbi:MAG TPA: lysophospholipid acyltransferase family protein [Glycomyces sp.]|nr:lysophospholipid acyltransferase family protein [Glycomyces sp.]
MTKETVEAHYAFRRAGGDRLNGLVHAVGGIVKGGLLLLTKRTWAGMHHIPLQGPVILVWNHYSDFDPLPVAHYVYNSGRHPRFLLKHSLLKIPVVGPIIKATGQIPVHRGRSDAADSLRTAIEVLTAGGTVLIAPEGSVTKEPDRWPMRGKTGVARLALTTGAPVVPIAQWGSLAVHDRHRSPKFKLGRRKPVTVVAGPPVDLSRWQGAEITREHLTAVTDTIMEALREGVAELRGEQPPPLFDLREHRKPRREDEESEPTE